MELTRYQVLFCLIQTLQYVTGFVNLSVNKTADMSSSQYSDTWLADEAVDGDVSQKVAQGSCAVTSDQFHKQAWWRVDLGGVYVLNSVKIYYRKEIDDPDQSLTYQLSGFAIYVADTLNWWIGTRCYLHNNGQHTNPGPSDILTVPCNATGRYVTVYKQRNGTCFWSSHYLAKLFCARIELCEVQALSCEDGTYGESCSKNCSGNCLNGAQCNKAHGGCDDGCAPGYRGFYCTEECSGGTYGRNCQSACFNCQSYKCNRMNGACESQCIDGYTGVFCNIYQESTYAIAISVTVVLPITVLGVSLFIWYIRVRSQSPPNDNRSSTTHHEQIGVHMSNMNVNTHDTGRGNHQESVRQSRSTVTYEDLISSTADSLTYEILQPNRNAIYTNTEIIWQ